MMTRYAGAGFVNPFDPVAVGEYFARQVQGGTTPVPAPAPQPGGDLVPPPPTPPPTPPMSDTTKYVLIGAGVLATGIVIYAVVSAKKRRR